MIFNIRDTTKLNYWDFLLLLAILTFFIQHIYFGKYHFHECDSVITFDYLKNASFEQMKKHIIITSPPNLLNIRLQTLSLSQQINFLPLKGFFKLPYLTTYTPIMGLLFGKFINNSFEQFYQICTLINALALSLSSLFIYKTCLNLDYKKSVSLFSSCCLLTLYATNSYSYHLGSTVWFIFSISAGIYLINYKNALLKDLSSFLLFFLSYPYIIWIFCEEFTKSLIFLVSNKISFKNLKSLIFNICKKRVFSIIGFFTVVTFFFPINSGYRYGPDLRGLYSIFSLEPLNNQNQLLPILFSFTIYSICLFGVIKNNNHLKIAFVNNDYFEKINNLYKQKIYVNTISFSFLIIFGILAIFQKLTFSTTRHSLFIIPAILILLACGLDEISKTFSEKLLKKFISPFLITLITIFFITSTNSTFKRVDVLKQNHLPKNIINFVKNMDNKNITMIECSPHYKYADFTKSNLKYDLIKPNKITKLYHPGYKLLISQRPSKYNNIFSKYLYKEIPKVGDEIYIDNEKVKITIVSKPYISKTSVYFDSLNKSSEFFNLFHSKQKFKNFLINTFFKSKIYSNNKNYEIIKDRYNFYSKTTGEEYPYSRPNDIWLIPIKVENL